MRLCIMCSSCFHLDLQLHMVSHLMLTENSDHPLPSTIFNCTGCDKSRDKSGIGLGHRGRREGLCRWLAGRTGSGAGARSKFCWVGCAVTMGGLHHAEQRCNECVGSMALQEDAS